MTPAALVLAAAVLALGLAPPFLRDWLVRSRRKQTVAATMKSGAAFRGVLYRSDPTTLLLRNAEQLSADGAHVKVDGELLLARAEIDFLQRP